MTELTPDDEQELARARDAVAMSKAAAANAHARQRALWTRLLTEDKPKAAIARSSGVTAMAITYALDKVPRRESTKA